MLELSWKTAENGKAVGESVVVAVPAAATQVTVWAKRENWPERPDPVVEIQLCISLDDGVVWHTFASIKAHGGQDPDGEHSWVNCLVPEPGTTDRKFKTVVILDSDLTTTITYEFV